MEFGPRVQQMSGRRAREDPLIPGLGPDGARDWKEIARSLLVECKSRGLRLQTCIIRFEFHVNLSMGKPHIGTECQSKETQTHAIVR